MDYEIIRILEKDEKFTTNKQIVEISCDMCDYDRGILTYSTYSSSGMVICNNPNCGNKIEEL